MTTGCLEDAEFGTKEQSIKVVFEKPLKILQTRGGNGLLLDGVFNLQAARRLKEQGHEGNIMQQDGKDLYKQQRDFIAQV